MQRTGKRKPVNTESILNFVEYDNQQEFLSKKFQERYRDFTLFQYQFALLSSPFIFDVTKEEEKLLMEFIEMESNSVFRILMWIYLVSFHITRKSLKPSQTLPQRL